MKIVRALGKQRFEGVIDLISEAIAEAWSAVVLIAQLESDRAPERHRNIGVDAAPFGHRDELRVKLCRATMGKTEKIAYRNRNAGFRHSIVEALKPQRSR